MKTSDLILLGGLAVGAFYLFKPKTQNTGLTFQSTDLRGLFDSYYAYTENIAKPPDTVNYTPGIGTDWLTPGTASDFWKSATTWW